VAAETVVAEVAVVQLVTLPGMRHALELELDRSALLDFAVQFHLAFLDTLELAWNARARRRGHPYLLSCATFPCF
jgi:hypothetical protein